MNKLRYLLIQIGAALLMAGLLANLALTPALGISAPALSQSSSTFTSDVDAYVNASTPTSNYGTGTTLRVDVSPIVNSFLRFTVKGLNGSPVTHASLSIYANSGSSQGLIARTVANKTWGETTINYSNMPVIGLSLASSGAVSSGTWITFNVTSYIVGDGTYSFALTTPGSTAISLASREAGANAPKLIVSYGSSSTPAVTPTRTPTTSPASAIKHVFVVVMENHSYKEVWNTGSSPYITQLGNSYARATNYHASTHPSLPNYLDMYAGSHYSITNDCSPSSSCHINAVNLADNLEAKGLTWKGYMESMPAACYLTTSGNYAPKHNPFVYFDDIRNNSTRCKNHDVPFTALATDLASAATTPNYAMLVPNLCNDMHNCSVTTGDTWLKNHLPAILNSPACTVDKCLLILTWDEDDSTQANQVLTIFAGSAAKTGGATSAISYTHFSLLRTIEKIFGLPTQTTKDAAASPMTDLLR
jgi:hypothetical protein